MATLAANRAVKYSTRVYMYFVRDVPWTAGRQS